MAADWVLVDLSKLALEVLALCLLFVLSCITVIKMLLLNSPATVVVETMG